MRAEPGTETKAQADVCLPMEKVRNANAERQRRFRQSDKGRDAYSARLQAKREDAQRHRNDRFARLNRDRALNPLGFYSGPLASEVPWRRTRLKRDRALNPLGFYSGLTKSQTAGSHGDQRGAGERHQARSSGRQLPGVLPTDRHSKKSLKGNPREKEKKQKCHLDS